MSVSNRQIKMILDSHNVRSEIIAGRVFGFLVYLDLRSGKYCEERTDLTGYTMPELRNYLGY